MALVWTSYVAFLLPNLGLLNFSNSITADRYSYLGTMGWVALLAAGLGARMPEHWGKTMRVFFLPWRSVFSRCCFIELAPKQDVGEQRSFLDTHQKSRW